MNLKVMLCNPCKNAGTAHSCPLTQKFSFVVILYYFYSMWRSAFGCSAGLIKFMTVQCYFTNFYSLLGINFTLPH